MHHIKQIMHDDKIMIDIQRHTISCVTMHHTSHHLYDMKL